MIIAQFETNMFYYSGNIIRKNPYIDGNSCKKCKEGQQCDNGLCQGKLYECGLILSFLISINGTILGLAP